MTLLFLADYNNRGAWLRFYVITLILTVGFYEEVVDGEGGGRAVAGRWQGRPRLSLCLAGLLCGGLLAWGSRES